MNKKFEKIKRFLRINLFVQQLRFQTFRWWYWVDLAANIIDRSRPIFDTFMLGLIINEVQLFVGKEITSLTNLYWFIGITVGVRIIAGLFGQFYFRFDWFFSYYAMQVAIEKAFMDKLSYLNWEHIENPKMEKRINMTFNRSLDYISRLADLHVDLVVFSITLVTTLLLVSAPTWIIILIILKELPSIYWTAKGAKMTNKVQDESQYEWIKKSSLFGYFRDFATLLEIKVARGEVFLKTVYDSVTQEIRRRFLEKDKKLLAPWLFISLYETVINSGIYVYYIYQVLFNGMLFGTFQYTTNLINQIGATMYRLIVRLNNSVDYYRYVSYAYELLHMQNDRPDGTIELDTNHIEIEFKDVWFKYPGAKRYSLKGVSIHIKDNERLAIVGENGAGKSTFLKLLHRIYVPTKGEILINGIPSHEYSAESYNKKIAVVTQDFARYMTLTVAQNIAIYDPNNTVSLERVREAARLANADEFVEQLPEKYNNFLTKKLEGGTEPSTGQWQRLAVARQFYSNRPLVILDEPTSAIDPIAEAQIFSNLYEHVRDKTVIVVSHRYNTVRAAERIIVFKDGQIIEQGTHDELISLNQYYAKAFSVQQTEKKL